MTALAAAAAAGLIGALAQAENVGGGYRPFWNPLPVWEYWYLLLLPLCLGISIAYKAIKCHSMRQVPREAAEIFFTILFFMVAAAAALVGLLWLVQKKG